MLRVKHLILGVGNLKGTHIKRFGNLSGMDGFFIKVSFTKEVKFASPTKDR